MMIVFWLLAGSLTLAAILTLIWPLLKPGDADAPPPPEGRGLAVHRDQLAELDRERAEGRIAAPEAAAARLEIERRILASDAERSRRPAPEAAGPRRRRRMIAATCLILLTPAGTALIYASVGSPGLPDQPHASREENPEDSPQDAPEDSREEAVRDILSLSPEARLERIEAMVANLAARLREDPDDSEGWQRLGRSYEALGQHDAALDAWEQAAARAPGQLAAQLAYARALYRRLGDEADLPDSFRRAAKRALILDPDQPEALFYGGLAAEADGDVLLARSLWTKLLTMIEVDAPVRPVLERRIADLADP